MPVDDSLGVSHERHAGQALGDMKLGVQFDPREVVGVRIQHHQRPKEGCAVPPVVVEHGLARLKQFDPPVVLG